MARYRYSAKSQGGAKDSGTVEAGSRQEAVENLRARGLIILNLHEEGHGLRVSLGGTKRRKASQYTRIKTMDLVIFTRMLATMINAGIPLLESLDIMAEQITNEAFRAVLSAVSDDVRSGSDFSTALMKYPRIFPEIYINMIRAGEASGQLDIILGRLADYQEASAQLTREIKSAMTYPCIAMVLVLSITIFLMVFIVPKFKEIFDDLEINLNVVTTTVINISMFMKNSFLYIIIVIAVIVVTCVILVKKTYTGKKTKDWLMLKIPVFGPLFSRVALSRFARTFSTLIKSGVPILASLEIVSGTAGNVLIAEAIDSARDSVRQGETLAEPLAESNLFPPMVTRMISIGERTGALEELLEKISQFYDEQVRATVDAMTSLIEPLLITFMGIVVGTIVLSIFLPIIQLQQHLAGG